MSHLLLTLYANKSLNRNLFRHKLFVYDDKIIYKARKLLKVTEVTISYNHISQVFLTKGVFFASLEIINTGGVKDIVIRYVSKKDASKAKEIIDAKIHKEEKKRPRGPYGYKEEDESISHRRHIKEDLKDFHLESIENSLNRLKELLHRGRISQKEYNKRKQKVLDKIHKS